MLHLDCSSGKNREKAPQHSLAKFISSDGDDKIIEELCTVIQQTVQYQPIQREPSAGKKKKRLSLLHLISLRKKEAGRCSPRFK